MEVTSFYCFGSSKSSHVTPFSEEFFRDMRKTTSPKYSSSCWIVKQKFLWRRSYRRFNFKSYYYRILSEGLCFSRLTHRSKTKHAQLKVKNLLKPKNNIFRCWLFRIKEKTQWFSSRFSTKKLDSLYWHVFTTFQIDFSLDMINHAHKSF